MLNWLKSRFAGPKLAGPPQLLQAFAPEQPTITQSGIRLEHGAWHIDARAEEQTIRLFEVENPAVEQCLLTYRAELKAVAISKCGAVCQDAESSSQKAINRQYRVRSTGLATRSPST